MAQKYYNSAETAKILGKTTDEVKTDVGAPRAARLSRRRRLEVQGRRHRSACRAIAPPSPPPEEDGGDVLLSEVALGQSDPGLSGTVIGLNAGGRLAVDSDIRLAESDLADALNEESTATAAKKKTEEDAKGAKFEDSGLNLERRSYAERQFRCDRRQGGRRRQFRHRSRRQRKEWTTTIWCSAAAARAATSPSAATAASR